MSDDWGNRFFEDLKGRENPEVQDGSPVARLDDGLDRLGRAVYGRPPKPGEWLGGSDARILHDAADKLEAAQKLCEVYFNIAAAAIGEDAVRKQRDELLGIQ